MKKTIIKKCSIMLCIVLLVYAIPVQADVIWEPENTFYLTHSDECVYHNRSYTANGPDGKVVVYQSPELNWKTETLKNGESVWISYIYKDTYGRDWGYWNEGWLPMDYMIVKYDYIDFEDDYGEQFIEKEIKLDASYNGQEIMFWSYPGSKGGTDIPADIELAFDTIFVDEEGRTWGFSPYYYGHRNSWVCVDAPTADFETLYPDGAPVRDTRELKPYAGEEIVPKTNPFVIVGTVLAVVVVVISTITILRMMKKKK